MEIHYYNRNLKCGFSINIVTQTIKQGIEKIYPTKEYYMPTHRAYPWHCLINILYTLFHRSFRKDIINHQTGDNHYLLIGLIGSKTVLTIHDLVCLNCKNPIKRLYKYILYIYLPVKIADRIVCISNTTKDSLLKHIKTQKACVIYNPINPIFQYTPKQFNAKCPRILHIGTGWNKNLDRVIQSLKDINCQLRIIGELDSKTITLLRENNINYSNAVNLSDEAIKEEYQQADIISFPSLYEGFGMPIIEGQKTGRIIITSNITPLTEIANDAAIFVNPYDIESIKKGFTTAINDDSLRNALINKGKLNVTKFELDNITNQYIELYNSIL